jgi:hypothetical protein
MRRAVATSLLLLACAGGPACGGDDGDAGDGADRGARDRLMTAIENARDSTVRAEFTMRVDSEWHGRYAMRGSVASTGDGSRATISRRFVDYRGAETMHMIMHEDEAWIRSPAEKRWLRTTDPAVFGTTTITPDAYAELLQAAGKVEDLGPETLDGVPSRRLRAVIDLDKLADKTRPVFGAGAFRQVLAGEAAGVTVDVWVTDEELPMRFRASVRLPREGGGKPETGYLGLDVDEYDVPLDADPPPASLVVDDSALE